MPFEDLPNGSASRPVRGKQRCARKRRVAPAHASAPFVYGVLVAPPIGQPCRAFQRGFRRLITKTFPCRLITRDPGLFFSDLTELRTFMAASSWLEPEACRSVEHVCQGWYSLAAGLVGPARRP